MRDISPERRPRITRSLSSLPNLWLGTGIEANSDIGGAEAVDHYEGVEAELEVEVFIMDEAQFRLRSLQFDDKIRDVDEAIEEFMVDDVFKPDADVDTPLEEIKNKFMT